jgi:hypothetical protein
LITARAMVREAQKNEAKAKERANKAATMFAGASFASFNSFNDFNTPASSGASFPLSGAAQAALNRAAGVAPKQADRGGHCTNLLPKDETAGSGSEMGLGLRTDLGPGSGKGKDSFSTGKDGNFKGGKKGNMRLSDGADGMTLGSSGQRTADMIGDDEEDRVFRSDKGKGLTRRQLANADAFWNYDFQGKKGKGKGKGGKGKDQWQVGDPNPMAMKSREERDKDIMHPEPVDPAGGDAPPPPPPPEEPPAGEPGADPKRYWRVADAAQDGQGRSRGPTDYIAAKKKRDEELAAAGTFGLTKKEIKDGSTLNEFYHFQGQDTKNLVETGGELDTKAIHRKQEAQAHRLTAGRTWYSTEGDAKMDAFLGGAADLGKAVQMAPLSATAAAKAPPKVTFAAPLPGQTASSKPAAPITAGLIPGVPGPNPVALVPAGLPGALLGAPTIAPGLNPAALVPAGLPGALLGAPVVAPPVQALVPAGLPGALPGAPIVAKTSAPGIPPPPPGMGMPMGPGSPPGMQPPGGMFGHLPPPPHKGMHGKNIGKGAIGGKPGVGKGGNLAPGAQILGPTGVPQDLSQPQFGSIGDNRRKTIGEERAWKALAQGRILPGSKVMRDGVQVDFRGKPVEEYDPSMGPPQMDPNYDENNYFDYSSSQGQAGSATKRNMLTAKVGQTAVNQTQLMDHMFSAGNAFMTGQSAEYDPESKGGKAGKLGGTGKGTWGKKGANTALVRVDPNSWAQHQDPQFGQTYVPKVTSMFDDHTAGTALEPEKQQFQEERKRRWDDVFKKNNKYKRAAEDEETPEEMAKREQKERMEAAARGEDMAEYEKKNLLKLGDGSSGSEGGNSNGPAPGSSTFPGANGTGPAAGSSTFPGGMGFDDLERKYGASLPTPATKSAALVSALNPATKAYIQYGNKGKGKAGGVSIGGRPGVPDVHGGISSVAGTTGDTPGNTRERMAFVDEPNGNWNHRKGKGKQGSPTHRPVKKSDKSMPMTAADDEGNEADTSRIPVTFKPIEPGKNKYLFAIGTSYLN